MRLLIYTDSAIDNLAELIVYIATESGSAALAEYYVETLRRRCRKLAELPGTLGTDRGDLRSGIWSVAHRNHLIFFRYLEDAVEIIDIVQASRDFAAYFDDPGEDT